MDSEGEAVDLVGTIGEYDLKIIGAHFSIFFNAMNGFDQLPGALFVTMAPYELALYRLTQEYFLLVLYRSPFHALINRFRVRELIAFIQNSL